ncbi:MAG: 1-acyl-sn-glycerol-3-phosphate acyltransferase [Candidatus Aminicenantes bacterium]|nr:MAG: 1-acyl-sn-glycerol-3-phosphate acyltransferase [Candidatus Aminicenantes bacterium]
MKQNVNKPLWLFSRKFLRTLIKPFLHLFKGFSIAGKENLPKKRASCIIISNHAAFADSIYMICAVRPRFTICGAKSKYFISSIKRFVFKIANIIKVVDKNQFLEDCGKLLESGEIILVYPEMGRNPDGLGEFKTWAAEVALSYQVPVIPCYIYGTTKSHQGSKRIVFGPPIEPRGNSIELTNCFRETILRLKPGNKNKNLVTNR